MINCNKFLLILGALSLSLSAVSCSKKDKKKNDTAQTDNESDSNSNNADSKNDANQVGDLEIEGIVRNIGIKLSSSYVSHSHALFILHTNMNGTKIKNVTIDGVKIEDGSDLLGDADEYLTGLVDEQAIEEFDLGMADPYEEKTEKNEILLNNSGQPYFYIKGFSKNLLEKDTTFKLVFDLEAEGKTAKHISIIDNTNK